MRNFLILLALFIPGLIFSQTNWKIDVAKSSLKFVISNFGANVDGSFSPPSGSIVFDADQLETSKFRMSVDASTVDTDNKQRDNHLKNEDFFEVENYPKINFVSTSVAKAGEEFNLMGKLTIKNISKDVLLPFTFKSHQEKGLFEGSFVINRKDYELGGMLPSGKEVTVKLYVVVGS